jgi:hypothetical protein
VHKANNSTCGIPESASQCFSPNHPKPITPNFTLLIVVLLLSSKVTTSVRERMERKKGMEKLFLPFPALVSFTY